MRQNNNSKNKIQEKETVYRKHTIDTGQTSSFSSSEEQNFLDSQISFPFRVTTRVKKAALSP